MGLISRTRKLILGNLYDLFDRFERPDQAARQSVRDLERAIDAAASATARSIASERLLRRHSEQLRGKVEDRARRAADAALAGDEPLAKLALRQKYDAVQALEETERRLAEAVAVNESLRAQLGAMRAHHRQAMDRVSLQAARQTAAAARCELAAAASHPSFDGPQVLTELDRSFDRVDRAIFETEARGELYRTDDGENERKFADARRDRFVAEEWARLISHAKVPE